MVGDKSQTKQSNGVASWGRRSKILATIGPSTDSYELIKHLIASGANGIRLNFSHGSYEERKRQIRWIRKAEKELGRNVAIVLDLQGPKIRLGDFEGVIEVKKGQILAFEKGADYVSSGHIPTQYDLSLKVKRGERILLLDGRIQCVVTTVKDGVVYAELINNGILIKRKGMNVPDTDFGGDVITDKDYADLIFGSTNDIDYVALSFVQSPDDIKHLRNLMAGMNFSAKIIAKIETKAAVENIEDIVKESDVVMVARGDLAVETTPESIPIVQRRIIGLGQLYATPTIVATQMLISMTEQLTPSRAEVSDVATAVLLGADCLMLSDETASGLYPIEAVKTMRDIICYTETHSPCDGGGDHYNKGHSLQLAISEAIIKLAQIIQAKAIIAETKSGATAIGVSACRIDIPLLAVTNDPITARQLSLVYGVESFLRPVDKKAALKLTDFLRAQEVFNKGDIVVTVSGKYPGVVGTTDTIKVRMLN